ncbi:hypothetical protein MMC32_001887 [Xylographa parallela]|nr:hypothetical protein [Xylographa parallela]
MKLTQNFLALLAFASATIVVANPIPVEADKKRDAAPEPEPTDYGSYSGYGTYPPAGSYSGYGAYKREADAVNAAIEEKRDAVPEPEPVAAAAPEPEPTNYGSYSGYGTYPPAGSYSGYGAYKREADAVNAVAEEKRDAVPEPEPVAAAVPEPVAAAEPEPEPTSYGTYANYGTYPPSYASYGTYPPAGSYSGYGSYKRALGYLVKRLWS